MVGLKNTSHTIELLKKKDQNWREKRRNNVKAAMGQGEKLGNIRIIYLKQGHILEKHILRFWTFFESVFLSQNFIFLRFFFSDL